MTPREAKRYDELSQEVQFLRRDNQFLRGDRDHYRREWYFTQQRLNQSQECNQRLREQNQHLKQQNQELRAASAKGSEDNPATTSPKFKPAVRRRRKKPGRKQGHPTDNWESTRWRPRCFCESTIVFRSGR